MTAETATPPPGETEGVDNKHTSSSYAQGTSPKPDRRFFNLAGALAVGGVHDAGVPEMVRNRGKFFGVWGLNVLGECNCPRGFWRQESRGAMIAGRGPCERPGKHPMVVKLEDGTLFGFPHGSKDAVGWDEWVEELAGSVGALGGHAAAVIPGSMWVLDVDNNKGWRGLVRLFKAGCLDFDRVVAVTQTPRGWHVWITADHPGWRTKTAQKALNAVLSRINAPLGLEAKSAGSYVLLPPGDDEFGSRRWMDVMGLAHRVSWHSRVHYTKHSVWKPPPSEEVPRLAAEVPPIAASEPAEDFAGEPTEEGMTVAWINLTVWCEQLAWVPEGGRNDALNRLAFLNGRPAVRAGHPVEEVRQVLYEAARRAGLGHDETQRTIRSGLGLG